MAVAWRRTANASRDERGRRADAVWEELLGTAHRRRPPHAPEEREHCDIANAKHAESLAAAEASRQGAFANRTLHGVEKLRYGSRIMRVSMSSVAGTLSLVAALLAAPAEAQNGPPSPAAPPAASAIELAKEAKTLLSKGQIDAACAKLEESVRLEPKSSTALDLASCLERKGSRAAAYAALERASSMAARDKQGLAERTARTRQKNLEKQIALVIVTPREGAAFSVDGTNLASTELATPLPLEPGAHRFAASAPEKRAWEQTIVLEAGTRQTLEIPVLEDLPKPPPPSKAPTAPAPAPEAAPPVLAPRIGLVIEAGFLGGLAHADVARGETSALNGLPYAFAGETGQVQAACGDTTTIPGAGECTGSLRAHSGGFIGGQLFVGWAVAPRLHVGLRALGGAFTPDGFLAAGGPGVSFRVMGPLWVGLAGVAGFERHRAVLDGGFGTIPPDAAQRAGVAEAPVALGDKLGANVAVDSGFVGGGNLEVSLALFRATRAAGEAASEALFVHTSKLAPLSGSLLVGAWPTVLAGSRGVALVIPAGVSYRFH